LAAIILTTSFILKAVFQPSFRLALPGFPLPAMIFDGLKKVVSVISS
jgi:hypothetical protein